MRKLELNTKLKYLMDSRSPVLGILVRVLYNLTIVLFVNSS